MTDIVIVGAKRTPIGSFLGQFTGVPTPLLGTTAIRGALDAHDVPVGLVVDLSDDLFDEILDRHYALAATVLVDDDDQLLAGRLHLPQGVEHQGRFRQEHRWPGLVAHHAIGPDEVAQVDDARHPVEINR